jgi:hypothetical protein
MTDVLKLRIFGPGTYEKLEIPLYTAAYSYYSLNIVNRDIPIMPPYLPDRYGAFITSRDV